MRRCTERKYCCTTGHGWQHEPVRDGSASLTWQLPPYPCWVRRWTAVRRGCCVHCVWARVHITQRVHTGSAKRANLRPRATCSPGQAWAQPRPSALSGHGGLPRAYDILVMVSVGGCWCRCYTGHMPAMRPTTRCLGVSCCMHACGAVCATAPGNSRAVRTAGGV